MLAGKLFKFIAPLPLEDVAKRLEGYRVEYEDEEVELTLVTEVELTPPMNDMLEGLLYKDKIVYLGSREGKKPVISTIRIPIYFRKVGERVFLLILAKKLLANDVANELSRVIFMRPGSIVEARVDPTIFIEYYRSSMEDARVVMFDDVDIPNVNVLALYGEALSDTELFKEYEKHGLLWYIVVKSRKRDIIVGLTRNCVITIFSQATEEDLKNFAFEEVIPLLLTEKE